MTTKKQANTNNINIRIPDLISNTTNKLNENTRLNDNDESDYELDTRKMTNSNNNSSSNKYVALQMQHEVNVLLESKSKMLKSS